MAKKTFLELTNRVLRRINQSEITDVSTVSGGSHAHIITNMINEAQNELFTETNWYSLYATRTFVTVADTAEYVVQSDFGRGISMIDETNDNMIFEEGIRPIDEADPNAGETGAPRVYTLQSGNYRFYPIPAGVYTIRERYWKSPTALAANSDTSDLPQECENCIINYALFRIYEYINNFDRADRARVEFERTLKRAKIANKRKINQLQVMRSGRAGINTSLIPPQLPSSYGYTWR